MPAITKPDERIDRIEAEISAIKTRLDCMDDNLKLIMDMNKKLDHHENTLYGNGKPGLVVEIDRLVQAIDGFKKVGWYLTAALISTGIVFAINAIIHAAIPTVP